MTDVVAKTVMEVRLWWNERLAAGCPFEYTDSLKPNLDYKGELPWPDRVRLRSLRCDYERSRDTFCPFFNTAYNRATLAKIQRGETHVNVDGHDVRRPEPWVKLPRHASPLPV